MSLFVGKVTSESGTGKRVRFWFLFTEILNEHIGTHAKSRIYALNMACKEGVNLLNLAIKFVKASLKPKLPINKQIIIRQPVNGKFIPFNIFSKVDFVHLSP